MATINGVPPAVTALEPRDSMDDATRRLCAGTYVDEEFRTVTLRRAYFDRRRCLPPSYGCTVVPVMIHARRAWLLDLGRLALVVATALAALLADPFALTAVVTVLFSWYGVGLAGRRVRAYVSFLRGRGDPEERNRIRAQAQLLGTALGVAWIALAVVFVGTGGAPRLDSLEETSARTRIGVLLAILASIALVHALVRQAALDLLRPGAAAPPWRVNLRLLTVEEEERRPVTVFSGPRAFVGSGVQLLTWSFAHVVRRGGVEPPVDEARPDLTSVELVDHLRQRILDLVDDPDPERKLPTLTVRDHLFVAGTRAGDVPEEPDRADIDAVLGDPTGPVRHYLACQVPSWHGELVTTVYVHVSLQGRTLYLEFSTWVLPPTRRAFKVADTVGATGLPAHLRAAAATAWHLPERLIHGRLSLLTLASAAAALVTGDRRRRQMARRIDVGAKLSVREAGAEIDDDPLGERPKIVVNHFQHRDIVHHSKIVERRLLDAVLDFLRDHGFDTDEFEQRAVTFLNSTIVNAGAISNSGVLQMGAGNQMTGVAGAGATPHAGQAAGGRNGHQK